MIVCGLHLGGLSHDDGNGKHSIATAIVVALAIALALQAAANREGVWPHQATGEHGPFSGYRPTPRHLPSGPRRDLARVHDKGQANTDLVRLGRPYRRATQPAA